MDSRWSSDRIPMDYYGLLLIYMHFYGFLQVLHHGVPIIVTGDRREEKEREDGRFRDRERWRGGDVEVEVEFLCSGSVDVEVDLIDTLPIQVAKAYTLSDTAQ